MEPQLEPTAGPDQEAALRGRAERALEDAAPAGDGERLALLEELYAELESELERDFGEAPSTRR